MSKLFSFRYNLSSLRFDLTSWQFQNTMFVPMKQTSDTCNERLPAGEVLFRRVRLFGDSLVSKSRGLWEFSMVGGLVVETEKRKGLCLTGILEEGSTGAQNKSREFSQ